MIFIDAREGLSGDMLLAGMLALMEAGERSELARRVEEASLSLDLEFRLSEIEDSGVRGFAISYIQPEPTVHGISHDESVALLRRIEQRLGSRSDVGMRILDLLFEAESEVHRLPVAEVHLHEVGRPQSMLNIAGIGLMASELEGMGAGEFVCSTIVTGSGIVVVAHGAVRVPAPASAVLLRGLRHEQGPSPGERATPTGVAAAKVLAKRQSDDVPAAFRREGVGFGTKRFSGRLGRTRLLWA